MCPLTPVFGLVSFFHFLEVFMMGDPFLTHEIQCWYRFLETTLLQNKVRWALELDLRSLITHGFYLEV